MDRARAGRDGSQKGNGQQEHHRFASRVELGVENGYFPQNPLQSMKLLKETDAESKVRYLTEAERTRLFAALNERENRLRDVRTNRNEWLAERGLQFLPELDGCFADHLKPMVILSLYSGIRRGTLFALR